MQKTDLGSRRLDVTSECARITYAQNLPMFFPGVTTPLSPSYLGKECAGSIPHANAEGEFQYASHRQREDRRGLTIGCLHTYDLTRNALNVTRPERSRGRLTAIFFFSFLFILISCLSIPAAASAEEVESKAAVVMDATTGRILYAKNPDVKLLPASTTKLMTALVVLERAKLSDITTVSRRAASAPPTKAGLKAGDKVTIETLLYAALMKSANDAAVALAEAVAGSEEEFVTLMNNRALAIGANDTRYINSNGLPGTGQYITAYDLAMIMRQAIKYPTIREILGTRITEISTETGKQIFIKNTNKLLWSDDEVLGGKTGYTRQAKHCFVCAGERDNDTIIVALLGAPRRDLLWKESEVLLGFGAKVMGHTEEPVVYFTRTGSDDAKVTTAAYTESSMVPESGKLIKKTGHRARHKKSGVISSKKRSKKNRSALAKNRQKNSARNKKVAGKGSAKKNPKEQEVAKQGENGPQG